MDQACLFEGALNQAHRLRRDPKLSGNLHVSLVAAGFTPQELALRLWYGRLNPERLPLMDQLMRGTITAEQARTDLDKYGSAS